MVCLCSVVHRLETFVPENSIWLAVRNCRSEVSAASAQFANADEIVCRITKPLRHTFAATKLNRRTMKKVPNHVSKSTFLLISASTPSQWRHTQPTTAPAHSINPRWPVWSLIKMKFILRERVRSVDELFSLITSSIVVRLAVHNLNDNIVFYFTSFFCCCCCHIFFCRKKLFIIITGINYKHTVVVWFGYTIVHQTKGQRERKQKKKHTNKHKRQSHRGPFDPMDDVDFGLCAQTW